MNLNKAIVIGNLTKDPELKSLPSGISVASFSVATNRIWKDKEGQRQEAAEFHNVVVFGKQAESVSQYLKKGSGILVEGRIQTRSWDTPEGKKVYRTEIVAENIQFGARPAEKREEVNDLDKTVEDLKAPVEKTKAQQKFEEDNAPIAYPEENIRPEDIPF